jgi:hypothetical protein
MSKHRMEDEDMPHDNDELISLFVEGLEPGAMVTKYVIVAEGIDPSGNRANYTATHTDATSWDVMGLLEYARAREQGAVIRSMLEENEDE